MGELSVVNSFDDTLELAHLLAIIEVAAKLLDENCSDADAAILRAHGAQLAAGREWPGALITSTRLGEESSGRRA